jgi:hypothetical protein
MSTNNDARNFLFINSRVEIKKQYWPALKGEKLSEKSEQPYKAAA